MSSKYIIIVLVTLLAGNKLSAQKFCNTCELQVKLKFYN